MSFYGIQVTGMKWFHRYLTNTNKLLPIKVSDLTLEVFFVVFLTALYWDHLFSFLYINGLCEVSKLCFTTIFTEDTNVFIQGNGMCEIEHSLKREIIELEKMD